MKKPVTLKLSIPEPCTQNWNEMTETERGRFCASCSKHVVDFTHFSDQQLKDFFAKNTASVCGRLGVDQMERELILREHSRRGLLIPKLFIGAALATALAGKAEAQQMNTRPLTMGKVMLSEPEKKVPEPESDVPIRIVGQVKDNFGEGVPFASVMIKETQNATVTDIDGNFRIDVPEQFNGKKITLMFSSVGYERRELEVLTSKSPVRVDLILTQMIQSFTMGILVVEVSDPQTKEREEIENLRVTDEDLWQRIFGWQKPPAGSTRNY